MFSKIIKIVLPIILVGIILLIAYKSYNETLDNTESPITVIPTNAAVILQLNDARSLRRKLKTYNIWNKLQNIKQIDVITNKAKQISDFFIANPITFASNALFISFHKVSSNTSATLFSANFSRKNIKQNKEIVTLFSKKISALEYDNQTIYFSDTLNGYISFKGDIIFFSDNKMLLTDAIRTSNKNTDNFFVNKLFSDCYSTISESADINLMVNYNHLLELSDIYTTSKSELSHFSGWTATDVKFKDNVILASGLSELNKSATNFTDIFSHQKAQKINILDIIPDNSTQLFAISFNNQQRIYERKNEVLQNKNEFWSWDKNRKMMEESSGTDYNEFISETDNEAGIFNTSSSLSSDNTYTYFNTKESIRANSLLQGMILSSSSYKDFNINKVMDRNFTANLFGNVLKTNNSFFTTIKDYLIFGNSEESLEYIIDHYISNNTLANNKSFRKLNSYLSNDANIFIYLNPGKIAKTLKDNLTNPASFTHDSDSIAKFTALSLQISSTKTKMLHNICLFHDDEYKESIKEEWYHPLDTFTTMDPQFIENHFTKERMILMQDNSNKLIALNSNGEELWGKQIDDKIIGKINIIDAYNNGKFQALFNTRKKLYLVDRNGNSVDEFPVKLPANTSMGHSLFDYDKNKKYRIMIVGDNNTLYNLDKKGKKILGWKHEKSVNSINQIPIHFIVNNKDYILNGKNNTTTKLLARNGSERVTFNGDYSFANKVNITKDGTLYAITLENKLWTAKVDGSTQIYELPNLNATSMILAHKGGYYITNKNSVSYINEANKEEFNVLLDSEINTISLSAGHTAITTNKSLYLLKNKKIIEGFPIDSDGYFNIADIDNNGKINVINLRQGFVYNYEIAN